MTAVNDTRGQDGNSQAGQAAAGHSSANVFDRPDTVRLRPLPPDPRVQSLWEEYLGVQYPGAQFSGAYNPWALYSGAQYSEAYDPWAQINPAHRAPAQTLLDPALEQGDRSISRSVGQKSRASDDLGTGNEATSHRAKRRKTGVAPAEGNDFPSPSQALAGHDDGNDEISAETNQGSHEAAQDGSPESEQEQEGSTGDQPQQRRRNMPSTKLADDDRVAGPSGIHLVHALGAFGPHPHVVTFKQLQLRWSKPHAKQRQGERTTFKKRFQKSVEVILKQCGRQESEKTYTKRFEVGNMAHLSHLLQPLPDVAWVHDEVRRENAYTHIFLETNPYSEETDHIYDRGSTTLIKTYATTTNPAAIRNPIAEDADFASQNQLSAINGIMRQITAAQHANVDWTSVQNQDAFIVACLMMKGITASMPEGARQHIREEVVRRSGPAPAEDAVEPGLNPYAAFETEASQYPVETWQTPQAADTFQQPETAVPSFTGPFSDPYNTTFDREFTHAGTPTDTTCAPSALPGYTQKAPATPFAPRTPYYPPFQQPFPAFDNAIYGYPGPQQQPNPASQNTVYEYYGNHQQSDQSVLHYSQPNFDFQQHSQPADRQSQYDHPPQPQGFADNTLLSSTSEEQKSTAQQGQDEVMMDVEADVAQQAHAFDGNEYVEGGQIVQRSPGMSDQLLFENLTSYLQRRSPSRDRENS